MMGREQGMQRWAWGQTGSQSFQASRGKIAGHAIKAQGSVKPWGKEEVSQGLKPLPDSPLSLVCVSFSSSYRDGLHSLSWNGFLAPSLTSAPEEGDSGP